MYRSLVKYLYILLMTFLFFVFHAYICSFCVFVYFPRCFCFIVCFLFSIIICFIIVIIIFCLFLFVFINCFHFFVRSLHGPGPRHKGPLLVKVEVICDLHSVVCMLGSGWVCGVLQPCSMGARRRGMGVFI